MPNALANLMERRLGYVGGESIDSPVIDNQLAKLMAGGGNFIRDDQTGVVTRLGQSVPQRMESQRVSTGSSMPVDYAQMAILARNTPDQARMRARAFLRDNPQYANEPGFTEEELTAKMSDNTLSDILAHKAKVQSEQQKLMLLNQKPKVSATFNAELGGYVYPPDEQNPQGRFVPLAGIKPKSQEKPMTELQGKSALFGSRAAVASDIIEGLTDKVGGSASDLQYWQNSWIPGAGRIANLASSPETQKMAQAQRDFVNAVLRLESGAVIGQDEFENAAKQYFPQPGDTPEVLAQKRQNREMAIQGLSMMGGEQAGSYIQQQRGANAPATNADAEAIAWARSNPNDPRAQQILQLHGM